MKKFILGLIVGLSLVSGFVYAYDVSVKWYKTDELETQWSYYEKTYDENTNIVCYSATGGNGARSISCLKNN